MAKKQNSSKKGKDVVLENDALELVAKDHSGEVVANCDNNGNSGIVISQSDIEKMIVTIRGQQVMIDRDLATCRHRTCCITRCNY